MRGAKLLGHQIHPMLIVFPLGMLGGSVAFDIVRLATGDIAFANVAYWLLGGGLIGGVLAAAFGVWDWAAIPNGTRAKRIGLFHAISTAAGLALFAISWGLRRSSPEFLPSAGALASSFLGLVSALVGGWFGGELVEQLGVGVHRGAHLDAPSSLFNGARREKPRPQPFGRAQLRPR